MRDAAERFWSKVDTSAGPEACWPWTAGGGSHGYGTFYPTHGEQWLAHRYSLTLTEGPAPIDKPFALHSRTCTTTRCVNPSHLRWGTQAENVADAASLGNMIRPRRTVCPSGHKMTRENTLVKVKRTKGREYEAHACRECNRLYLAARRAARKERSNGE